VPNIQSSWVTQGLKIGQLALFFGANDMGSLMIEENVVSAAGTVHHLTLEEIKGAIREAGYIPRQRNVLYQYIDEESLVSHPLAVANRAPRVGGSLPLVSCN
jgi:cyclic dehypoxanthinyl futalosine synthase